MKYAGMIKNDFAAAPGVCCTFFVQGCDRHCPGCHNPEAQDFSGGREFTPEVLNEFIQAITANGLKRSVCIMGGEPLAPANRFLTLLICKTVREKFPDIKIYIWSGYTIEELVEEVADKKLQSIIDGTYADFIIDGPYIQEQRDITLFMRGSANQRIIPLPYSKDEQ